jgi:hypothetical protein
VMRHSGLHTAWPESTANINIIPEKSVKMAFSLSTTKLIHP